MAATGRIVASIYSFNGNPIGRAGLSGISNSFPSSQTMFFAAPLGTTANTVTINSIIVLLPDGLRVNNKEYGTDSTVAQLQTNGF